MDLENERIYLINIEDEMQNAYIDYSMSVIVGRALPDARDGLKPGNRRILYAMRERGWNHNKAYVKCAKVVGEVIGNYHPHGDVAVYDTLVRMAQDFSMRCLLIDGQGNFGSIDGDSPAAYRYTECRLLAQAEEMLADIDKDTVDMRPNFDETLMEPTVLPSRVPNLLVNGSTGIAVGMATNIPPHNLGEVIDGIIHLIDHPEAEIIDLRQFIKGPDFPTGGVIHGFAGVRDMYNSGRGCIKVRGRARIEEAKQGGKDQIIINEIPYALNKSKLIQKMANLVHEKRLDGISDIRDESGKEGIRIVVDLKKNAISNVVLNNIYKLTPLESTFGAIMLAIDHGKPRVMNLKEIMECFIDHRLEVITRRTEYELRKAEERAHILEGYRIALDNMDEIVRIIREASDREDAHSRMMARFGLSDIQTKAILELQLYRLTGMERDKIEQEYEEILKRINYLRELLGSRKLLFGVIKEDLLDIKKRFGDERRTDIIVDEGEIDILDMIADEPCVITVSNTGYIKRVPLTVYRQQKRGGKGKVGMATKEEDFVEHLFVASTHDFILFFTDKGKMYWLPVHQLPEGSRTSQGRAIVNLLQFESDEKIANMMKVREFNESLFLVMATERGVVKKTTLSAYKNLRATGLIAINIDEGDRVIGVRLTNGENELILSSRCGKSIRFSENQLRDQGRNTRGVRGMMLTEGDALNSIEVIRPETSMLVVTENGYGKRTSFEEYRAQQRGGQGIITIKTSERNGHVVSAYAVEDSDSLMMISEGGQMIRFAVNDIRVISRNTQGVRLIHLDEDDRLIAAIPIREESVGEEGEEALGQESESGEKTEQTEGVAAEPVAAEDEPVMLEVVDGPDATDVADVAYTPDATDVPDDPDDSDDSEIP